VRCAVHCALYTARCALCAERSALLSHMRYDWPIGTPVHALPLAGRLHSTSRVCVWIPICRLIAYRTVRIAHIISSMAIAAEALHCCADRIGSALIRRLTTIARSAFGFIGRISSIPSNPSAPMRVDAAYRSIAIALHRHPPRRTAMSIGLGLGLGIGIWDGFCGGLRARLSV
jgi:hypothetical protein